MIVERTRVPATLEMTICAGVGNLANCAASPAISSRRTCPDSSRFSRASPAARARNSPHLRNVLPMSIKRSKSDLRAALIAVLCPVRSSDRVERKDRPREFPVTIHRQIGVGDARAGAFDDVRGDRLEPGAIMDARLEHDVALARGVDAAMGEHAQIHRL